MDQKILKTHVLIVGGGSVGSGLLRDLALHGIDVILIDKKDFNSQTSSKSSKMLHGGIRYLETMDFHLVSEALLEKNSWLKLAPHLAVEKKFFLPTFKTSKFPLPLLWCGVKLYDALSFFKNQSSYVIGKNKTLLEFKGLNDHQLTGAAVYYDSIVDDHKLGLECIYDALIEPNAKAFNYTEILDLDKKEGLYQAQVKNLLTSEVYTIEAKEIIFATGPFTDRLINKLKLPWENKLLLSKGSHLWIQKDSLPLNNNALVIQASGGRVIFVIPERDAILVGTTEVPINSEDELFDIHASEEEITYLLDHINGYFPKADITKDHIISTFSGIRPLVRDHHAQDRSKTSREHLLYHIRPDLHVLIGGKLTTFRVMGQDLTKMICKRSKVNYDKKKTLSPLRRPSIFKGNDLSILTDTMIKEIIDEEMPRTKEDFIKRRLSMIEDEISEELNKKLDQYFN